MKFGVREICDVVLRARSTQKIGNKIFYKNEPVCYFDTLKTSTLEGTATTVYAQGGRGNTRLTSWDGERTVTFTMEDALISPIGLSILTGAGLIDASDDHSVIQHVTETVKKKDGFFYISKEPYIEDDGRSIYAMITDENGELYSEPYLCKATETDGKYKLSFATPDGTTLDINKYSNYEQGVPTGVKAISEADYLLVDYYIEHKSNAFEIDITADKFGGTFYLEASTLWRDSGTGKDLPAEFIIPKCRVQSNFTFSMSSSGDPSTFTFTIDAFPAPTRWSGAKEVIAEIQVIGQTVGGKNEDLRPSTWTSDRVDEDNLITKALDAPILATSNPVSYSNANGKVTVSLNNAEEANKFDYLQVSIFKDGTMIRSLYGASKQTFECYFETPSAENAGSYDVQIIGFKNGNKSKVTSGTFSITYTSGGSSGGG